MRPDADLAIGMFDLVASRLPPQRPLSEQERAMLRPPLEDVLYKYGAGLPPEWELAVAALVVVGSRFVEAKDAAAAKKAAEQPAAQPPQEVKAA